MNNYTVKSQFNDLMRRCYNEKDKLYKDYGAKGITICDDWKDFDTFANWCKINGFNGSKRVVRIDSKKGYCPDNCIISDKTTLKSYNVKNRKRTENNKKKKEEIGCKKFKEHKLYRTYHGMITRCYNKNHEHYDRYGGRGIFVCKEWKGKDGFYNFCKWQ